MLEHSSNSRSGAAVSCWSSGRWSRWAPVLAARRLSIDAVPDVTNTQVSVLTSAPGLSPVEVEKYLTFPIETAMNGVPGVSQIRSISRTAVSAVTIVFRDGTDPWFARQLVNERLKLAETDIPPGYGHPELAPVSTGLGEIYEFYLTSDRHSPMELRTLLDWTVAYRLRSVPGVVEVNGMGGEAKQYQVVLDPRRLAGYHLSLQQVERALRENNASIGGGYVERHGESYVIRSEGQFHSIEDIEDTVLASDQDGTPVLLRNVATVRIGPALRFGAVTKHGDGEIVAGTVMMLTGSNSREVVGAVKQRLAEIQADLPVGVVIRSYYDRAEFINSHAQDGRDQSRGRGAARRDRPVSHPRQLPRLADRGARHPARDGYRGHRHGAARGDRQPHVARRHRFRSAGRRRDRDARARAGSHRRARDDVARADSRQVASAMKRAARPVTFSLAIILLVYMPLLALEGVEGRMFRPMAVTVGLALGGALLFSLTAFPALAAFLLQAPRRAHDAEHGIWATLRRRYQTLLEHLLAWPQPTLGVALLLLAGAGFLGSRLGAEFVPRLDEGELSLDIKRLPSVSISEAQRLGVQVENVLGRFHEVLSVVTRTGRAEVATDPVGPDETEVMVKLRPKEEWTNAADLDGLGERIKRAIEGEVPATFVSVSQPIEDRVNQLLAGSRADVVIKVFGDDLKTLKTVADEIGAVVRDVPGRGDWRVQRVLGLPLLEVNPDRKRLARYGMSIEPLLEVVEASRVGRFAGKIFEGPRRFDLMLLEPPASPGPAGLGELLVAAPGGQLVPVSAVATVRDSEGPAVINRESLQRRVLVEVNVRGRDLVGFVKDAQQRVAERVRLPHGVRVAWGGQFENFTRARDRLLFVVPVALGIIFGMLFLMFGDVRYAVAVFAGAPFALIGGVLALWLRGLPFSIPAAVGFIAVAGVAVLNGVVMASEVRVRLDARVAGADPITGGAITVLRPVLTTALVAAVGFVPMALSTRAGAEVQRPLATVVIGGILSSTILALGVLPVLLRLLVARPQLRETVR